MFGILLLAFVLRLAHALPQERATIYTERGGDSWWYLEYGRLLVRGQEPAPPPSGPVYLIFVGIPQALASPETAILLVRLLQALLGAATCYFAYRLAWLAGKDERAGVLVAGVLAVSPAFVIEPAQILTETLYLFLLSGSLWLFTVMITRSGATPSSPIPLRYAVLLGIVLGLATLTRAVLLAFPLLLIAYMLLVLGWRRGLRGALALLLVYALTVSMWTIYNRAKWNQWVIGAQGFAAFLFIGASEGGWQGPQQTDQTLAQQTGVNGELPTDPSQQQQLYGDAAAQRILGDLGGWFAHRASELGNALLQPHGTVFYPGESLKDLAGRWWRDDRSLSGLIGLAQGDAFWPKLAIYIFHYVGLILGLVGMWLTRCNWRITLPLVGLIVYTLLVHFVLDAIPRYLFPLDLFFWVFAAVTISRWLAVASRQTHSPIAGS